MKNRLSLMLDNFSPIRFVCRGFTRSERLINDVVVVIGVVYLINQNLLMRRVVREEICATESTLDER